VKEAFVVTHDGERGKGQREFEEGEQVEDEPEVGEQSVPLCTERAWCIAESLAPGFCQDGIVRSYDRSVGAYCIDSAAVGAEGQRSRSGDVFEEPVEVQEENFFNEKAVPSRKGLYVVFKGEEDWLYWLCSHRVLESSDDEAGLMGKVNGGGIRRRGRDCEGGLRVVESIPSAAVSFLAVAVVSIAIIGHVEGLCTGRIEG
jgi:hypothetical protein